MSNQQSYTITSLNQIVVHHLVNVRQVSIRVENSTRYFVYVAVGMFANVQDIKTQAALPIPPGGSRSMFIRIRSGFPILSIAATDDPYAVAGTIAGFTDQVKVFESPQLDPKAVSEVYPTAVMGDYLIIAGRRIIATQQGFFAQNLTNGPVLGVNLEFGYPYEGGATPKVLEPGDVIIGRGNHYIWWDDAHGTLNVNGNINVLGGSGLQIVSVEGQFTPTGSAALSWGAGLIRLSDGSTRTYLAGSASATPPAPLSFYLTYDIVVDNHVIDPIGIGSPIPTDNRVLAVFLYGLPIGSCMVYNGGTLISGGQIITHSIITDNLEATAIDGMTVTGAILRTDGGSPPQVQIDSNGVEILADNAAWVKWVSATNSEVSSMIAYDLITPSGTNLILSSNPNFARTTGGAEISAMGSVGGVGLSAKLKMAAGSASDFIAMSIAKAAAYLAEFNIKKVAGGTYGFIRDQVGTFLGLTIGSGNQPTAGYLLDVQGATIATGNVRSDGVFNHLGTNGISVTLALAKLTPGGSNGQAIMSGGIITQYTAPT